ncbi:MAG: GerAB/ArcD/ProY family transporter, partial [Clostridia bacterium]|nr:GerAB/ArcD/ProY family transporter [Clostridia bacterium]
VLTFILVLPIYFLYKHDQTKDLIDNSYKLLGKFGFMIAAFYSIYFLCVCIYNFTFYNNYISNIMAPKVSLVLISVSIIACALYGAFKGITGIAQTSTIVFILFVAGTLFLICSQMPLVKDYNFTPFFYSGTETFFTEAQIMLSHCPCIALIGMLFPLVKGDMKKGIFLWNSGVFLTLILLTFVMVGSLGDYIKTQMFPFYSMSAIAGIGIFKRMDSLYIALWTSGLFIKISLFLYAFTICIEKFLGRKKAKIALFIGSALVCVISLFISFKSDIYFFLQNSISVTVFTLTATTFIPLVLLVLSKFKKRSVSSSKL